MSDIERTEFELPGSSLPTPRPEPGNQPAGQQPNNELSGAQISGDTEFDSSLRPKSLTEFIGQPKVRQQLELVLGGARSSKRRGSSRQAPAPIPSAARCPKAAPGGWTASTPVSAPPT